MADQRDQGASRAADVQHRRLPFAPIFDTIVAEPLHEIPYPTEEFGTKVTTSRERPPDALPRDFHPRGAGSNGLNRPVRFPEPDKPEEVVSHPAKLPIRILGLGILAILVAVIYLNWQFRRESYALSDLSTSTSKLASALSADQKLEQRPWVNIVDMSPQPLAVAPGAFNVFLQNSGKTAALDVKISGTAQLTGTDIPANQAVAPVKRDAGSLFAGSQFKTVLDFRPSPAVLAQLYRGRGHLEIHVDVSYKDVLQASHVSQACWSWQPAFRQMEACPSSGSIN